jgi:SAM-dependent methyltransferase
MESLAFEQLAQLEREHWWFRGRRAVYLGLIAELLGTSRPRRALDLGAGVGGFVEGLRELCDDVVAVDVDARGLADCRRRGARPLRAAGSALPFADGSFDLVCLFDVLEHLADDSAALVEVARVLRPGGLCFLSVPAWPLLFAENDRVAQHHRRYRRGALARQCARAGLVVERNTHTNALLFPLIAPLVLAGKVWETWAPGGSRGRTNLSWSPPEFVNEFCYQAFAAELALSRHVDLPLGHSIALAARRGVPLDGASESPARMGRTA